MAAVFSVEVRPDLAPSGKDVVGMSVDGNGSAAAIVATSAVAVAWGFNHYIKYYCNSQVSWDTVRIGKQLVRH